MLIVVGEKSVYIRTSDVLLVEVEHCDIGVILEYHAGDDLIAHMKGLSGTVVSDVLTQLYYLARSLMTEDDGDKSEGVSLEFVCVRTAYSAASMSAMKFACVSIAPFGLPVVPDV